MPTLVALVTIIGLNLIIALYWENFPTKGINKPFQEKKRKFNFASLQQREQDGSPAAVLEPSEKIRPGFLFLPRLLKPTRPDPEVGP